MYLYIYVVLYIYTHVGTVTLVVQLCTDLFLRISLFSPPSQLQNAFMCPVVKSAYGPNWIIMTWDPVRRRIISHLVEIRVSEHSACSEPL